MDVSDWLRSLGLERYERLFHENDITLAILPDLTDADLRELGLPLGPRKLILRAASSSVGTDREARYRHPEDPNQDEEFRRPSPRRAERRHLSLLFADLVGSTEIAERYDPEDVGEVLRTFQNAVSTEISLRGGRVAKIMGDGVLAYFGWPRANENDAERAVLAALGLTKAVAELRGPGGEYLAARAGVASGVVVVGDVIGEGTAREETVVGATPNLAARLQALAEPGGVLISAGTHRLVAGLFECEFLGSVALKGVEEAVPVWRTLREARARTRFEALRGPRLSPLVGRDREIALILECWRRAEAAEGQTVLIVGEAGIGKSRIVQEVDEALSDRVRRRLRFQCSPHRVSSAFWPVIEHLTVAAGVLPEDDLAQRLMKIKALFEPVAADADLAARLVGALTGALDDRALKEIGLTAAQRRAKIFDVLIDLLLSLAKCGPVLCVFEDMHWIDPSSLELLGRLADRITRAPVLLLATSRTAEQLPFSAHLPITRLSLDRLKRASVKKIVTKIAATRILDARLVSDIVSRSDGLPLFVEEITKAVIETKAGKSAASARSTAGAGQTVPDSLYDSLMARLDRAPGVKGLAETAACIGRDFNHKLLSRISDFSQAEVTAALDQLVAAGLIFRRGRGTNAYFVFKHALVRDAAYASLLKDRKRKIHERILTQLEADGGAPPEILAQHAFEAGLIDRSAELWRLAGEAALGRPAYAEAASNFARARTLLERQDQPVDERVLALLVMEGQALIALRGYGHPETAATFARARALVASHPASPVKFQALYGDWVGCYTRSDFPTGVDRAEAFLAAAAEAQDADAALVGHRVLGISRLIVGDFSGAERELQQAVDLYWPERHADLASRFGHEPGVGALCYLSWTRWFLGRYGAADEHIARAEELVTRTSHVNSRAYYLSHAARVELYQGRVPRVARLAHELGKLADEHGLLMWKANAAFLTGWSLYRSGESAEGLVGMASGLSQCEAAYARILRPADRIAMADLLMRAGDKEKAGEALAQARREHETGGQFWLAADLLRARAELTLLEAGAASDAERLLVLSLERAERQRAHALSLRAGVLLARLWAEDGERRRAVDLLISVCASVDQAVSNADLEDARALLSSLC